ncbi:Hypothetical_protein [Hexamita inflata]|uniref:Hypothetical_protein n=1 Tax=Hexamita inflata TaxID=28002 RepID=A0AA86U060_9EUKA|nr:Hypothetical protein HINF_LOCUS21167 [Hexamita inflata]
MIPASKCKLVFKARHCQYNTENSLNRIEITLSQRISPKSSFISAWKANLLGNSALFCQHNKIANIGSSGSKYRPSPESSLFHCILFRCSAYEENNQMLGKYTQSILQSEFLVKIKFSGSSCHLSNSLSLVEWMNMCKFYDWLFSCNKCAIAILYIAFKIKLQQLWCKNWYCAVVVYKSKIFVERKLLDGVK